MPRFAQLVVGPAGSGKSTYCSIMQEHFLVQKKTVRVINMDPAAEEFKYNCEIDVRDLISSDEVMEELHYGPNGALMYAMEYILNNLEWLDELLGQYSDDEYFIFDCPGQIELYSHMPFMRNFVDHLQMQDFRICGVYCMEAPFCMEPHKFISGSLTALSAMVNLELPHVNVLTKCDLILGVSEKDKTTEEDYEALQEFLDGDVSSMVENLNRTPGMPSKYKRLHQAMASLLEDYSIVSFVTLNPLDDESIDLVMGHVHQCINFGEDQEPRDPDAGRAEPEDDGDFEYDAPDM